MSEKYVKWFRTGRCRRYVLYSVVIKVTKYRIDVNTVFFVRFSFFFAGGSGKMREKSVEVVDYGI